MALRSCFSITDDYSVLCHALACKIGTVMIKLIHNIGLFFFDITDDFLTAVTASQQVIIFVDLFLVIK